MHGARSRFFVLERSLGTSELGCVYVGRQVASAATALWSRCNFDDDGKLGSTVCLKEIRWGKMSEEQRLSAIQEARLLQELNHPCVVSFVCTGFASTEPIPAAVYERAQRTDGGGGSGSVASAFSAARGAGDGNGFDEPRTVIGMHQLELSLFAQPDLLQLVRRPDAPSVFYIVMEYCSGGDLAQCIRAKLEQQANLGSVGLGRGGAASSSSSSSGVAAAAAAAGAYFSEELVLQWTVQVVLALGRIHCQSQPMLHRDLKVGNVFLHGDNGPHATRMIP